MERGSPVKCSTKKVADRPGRFNQPMSEKEFLEKVFIPCLQAQIEMARQRIKQLESKTR